LSDSPLINRFQEQRQPVSALLTLRSSEDKSHIDGQKDHNLQIQNTGGSHQAAATEPNTDKNGKKKGQYYYESSIEAWEGKK